MVEATGIRPPALQGDGYGPRCLPLLLQIASKARATDVHMEPKGGEDNLVRMRVDGQMVSLVEMPPAPSATSSAA